MLEKLLSISSPALAGTAHPVELPPFASTVYAELRQMLEVKNGFYAFESALHVYPIRETGDEIGLENWNSRELWRSEYQNMTDGCLFFAEDIFGVQFALRQHDICTFDPESGDQKPFAQNLEDWAATILADYDLHTGYPLAHQWQSKNGTLKPGQRLIPKIPFVMNGAYGLDNLYAGDAVRGMRFRGNIAAQIRHLPDGTKVKLRVTD